MDYTKPAIMRSGMARHSLTIAALAFLLSGCSAEKSMKCVFPGEHWEHLAPEPAGFDVDGLAGFVDHVGGSGCVVRYGRLIHGWGHYGRRHDAASAAKPVYAHLVYKSIDLGLIDSLDSLVVDHQPDLAQLNAELGFKDRLITWRHLVTQTAAYGVMEQPGDAFNYCDRQMALLIDTLVRRVHGCGFLRADEEMLAPLMTDLIQCQDKPTLNTTGSYAGRLRISPRDFARFGLLYLSQGNWNGLQILRQNHATQAVTSPHPPDFPRTGFVDAEMIPGQRSIGSGANQEPHLGSYSYTWWVNGLDDRGKRLLPDLPEDTFLASGHSGTEALVVIPSLDLVVCWIDAFPGKHTTSFHSDGRELINEAVAHLMGAMPR